MDSRKCQTVSVSLVETGDFPLLFKWSFQWVRRSGGSGTGRVLAWIEAGHDAPLLGAHVVGQDQPLAEKLDGTGGGDTGGAEEQLAGLPERFIRRNEVEDLAAQVPDLSVEMGDALVPASDQEVGCRCGLLRRMELVLGLGVELVQRCDMARAGANGQGQVVAAMGVKGMRWANGTKHRGIDGIGLVRVCIASAKRWAALGLITMRASQRHPERGRGDTGR